MRILNAEQLKTLLKAAGKDTNEVSEQDLLDLGFERTKAWFSKDASLVIFEAKGGLHNIGVAFWHV